MKQLCTACGGSGAGPLWPYTIFASTCAACRGVGFRLVPQCVTPLPDLPAEFDAYVSVALVPESPVAAER